MTALKMHGDGETIDWQGNIPIDLSCCDGCGAMVYVRIGKLAIDGRDVHLQWHKDQDAKAS